MSSEAVTSWLIHANWFFLALWLVLLAFAVVASFPRSSGTAQNQRHRSQGFNAGD
jgi:hypothetical protein